jgi:hypothetical protein
MSFCEKSTLLMLTSTVTVPAAPAGAVHTAAAPVAVPNTTDVPKRQNTALLTNDAAPVTVTLVLPAVTPPQGEIAEIITTATVRMVMSACRACDDGVQRTVISKPERRDRHGLGVVGHTHQCGT